MQLLGHEGMVRGSGVERNYRDARYSIAYYSLAKYGIAYISIMIPYHTAVMTSHSILYLVTGYQSPSKPVCPPGSLRYTREPPRSRPW